MIALFLLTVLQAPTVDSVVAIRAGAVVDIERGTLLPDALIVVRGGRIVSVGPVRGARVPAGAGTIDLSGMTVMPGLIDAHVHLLLAGAPRANAAATLRAGF